MKSVRSKILQGLMLGPFLFPICISDLSDGIESACKIFTNDTSLFLKLFNINESLNELITDLEKIN